MEATTLLIKDHEAVKTLFEQFEAAGDAAYKLKKSIFETIKSELLVHMDIEESIFYPAVKAQPSEELKDEIREADEEHHVAKLLMAEISEMKPEDEQYDAKVTVLRENIEHHVKEEEGELFPNTKKRLSKEMLEQLGEEMEERKESLTEDAEVALETRLMDRDAKLLREVERALDKVKANTYGLCEGTEEPIGYARLKLRPWTR